MGKRYTGPCTICGKVSLYKDPSTVCRFCYLAKTKEREMHTNATNRLKHKVLIKERGNKCELCGATGTLHAHHIKPLKDGGKDEVGNLLLVCPDCHKRIHKDMRQ